MKTEELAETFAKEHLVELENGVYLVHSAAVKFVSLILAESEDVDTEVLTVASWLHNIGRVRGSSDSESADSQIADRESADRGSADNESADRERADREVLAFESAKHLFQNLSSDAYYRLSDCLLNHGAAERPETVEGQILHDAERIAFLHPTYLDFLKAEFEREKTPEKFREVVEKKLKTKSELILDKSRDLFDDYALFAKDML